MKKLRNLTFSFFCLLAAYTLYAANDPDLSKGLDLTGRTTVTPYQLNQLVDAGTVRTNRGLLLITNAAPNVVAYPRYTNMVWLDQSSIPFVLKTWNANSNAWLAVSFGTNAITTAQIGDGQITTAKIADGAVTTIKLGDNSVTSDKIIAGQITSSKMANNSVTTLSITNGAVTTEKLAINSVNTTNVVDGAITSNKIAAATITSDKFAPGAIGAASISDNSITAAKMQADSIRATNIVNGAITTNKLSFLLYQSTNSTVAIPAAGATSTFTHGLTSTPHSVRVVLVNGTTDLQWDAGDEVDVFAVLDSNSRPAFTVNATATTIRITRSSALAATTGLMMSKDDGSYSTGTITIANWTLKVYAVYFPAY
jgi:hypothetical protein